MSLYQSICQYGIIVWGGATENILKPLITQQNKVIRISLNKCNKIGSTNKNYLELSVLQVSQLYKKFTISFSFKKLSPLKNITYK
jgi:hypothetical protein